MIDKPIQELTVGDLNRLYKSGEECDKRVFAEMRTNLQLVAGEHYVKEGSKYWQRIRDDKSLSTEQRLKLTKNHLQRVAKLYRNGIESFAPGVGFGPANQNELQDQKSAQLNQSVWEYIKVQENIPAKIAEWIQNFVETGEVHTKIFWDLDGGQIIGYEAEMKPGLNGAPDEPLLDETGQPVQSTRPVYGGKVRFETLEGYNVKRDPDARTFAESPYIILSKLRPKSALQTWVKDPEERKKFEEAPSEEYTVYDNNTSTYRAMSDQVLVKEIFFRPAPVIPNGYFFIYTNGTIIAQGELPHGIFPVISAFFDSQTGNARGHSVIRHCRPAQIEINRCASVIAETQVTVGWDKVWIQQNTKIQQGALLPGARVNSYSGAPPIVTEGRSGDQYFTYLAGQIDELYRLANLSEIVEERQDSADLYTNLFRSYRFRGKFAIYGQKFERFLIEVVQTALDIMRKSASEEEIIPAIGRNERINMSEFKNSTPLSYQVRLEPRSDDIESQFGKQITLNHIFQYIGPQLGKENIGQLLRLSPFLNKEQMLKQFTQKYDRVTNDILALDRGQFRPPRKYDDHDYILEALSTRMSEPDYEQLPPQVQVLYETKIQQHEELKRQQIIALQRAEAGLIPSNGFMVACDFYISKDPSNPQKTQRVRIPSEALNWLIEQLEAQGSVVDKLDTMNKGVVEEMANGMPPTQQQQQPGGMNVGSIARVA